MTDGNEKSDSDAEEPDPMLKVGCLSIQWLTQPEPVAYGFAARLAEIASSEVHLYIGSNTYTSYTRLELEALGKKFARDEMAEDLILDWVANLPWDEHENVTLVFNW